MDLPLLLEHELNTGLVVFGVIVAILGLIMIPWLRLVYRTRRQTYQVGTVVSAAGVLLVAYGYANYYNERIVNDHDWLLEDQSLWLKLLLWVPTIAIPVFYWFIAERIVDRHREDERAEKTRYTKP